MREKHSADIVDHYYYQSTAAAILEERIFNASLDKHLTIQENIADQVTSK